MPKYRKKPVVIDAWKWDGTFGQIGVCGREDRQAHVHTAHGGQIVFLDKGDWIVPEKEQGRHYPIKPDVFEATYEAV
jgi:hypothetical protein